MRDSSGALWKLLRSEVPIAIIMYPDHEVRRELIDQLKLLAPRGATFVETQDISQALTHPDTFILLTPVNEAQAVMELDGLREQLLDRRVPAVLFLLRGGKGIRSLGDAPGLASWVQESEVDPEQLERIDLQAERQRFQEQTGRTPDAWLAEYRAGTIPDTLENSILENRARLLEELP